MQIALNEHGRTLMLFIGEQDPHGHYPLSFTLDDPGPKDVDIAALGHAEKTQLLYNYRRGALLVRETDREEFLKLTQDTPAAVKSYTTGAEVPIDPKEPPKNALQQQSELEVKLKSYLKSHWAAIKKEIPNMDMPTIKNLRVLEEAGKGRKSLLKAFDAAIEAHVKSVQSKVAGPDIAGMVHEVGLGNLPSTNISDVVESDEEEVLLIPPDED